MGDRTPFLMALATDAARRFGVHLPRVIADGADRVSRAECLIAAWLAGVVLTAGTALQHKLAHVLGGLGLPHAETHAIILPHVTRFNLAAAPEAQARLMEALGGDPATVLPSCCGVSRSRSGWRRSDSIVPRSISWQARWRRWRSARRERCRPKTCAPCSQPRISANRFGLTAISLQTFGRMIYPEKSATFRIMLALTCRCGCP